MIINAAAQFDESRFLEGLRLGRFTAIEIQDMTSRVRFYKERLEIEGRHLAAYSESFLKDYATDNNECFETAKSLFNRLRSTISASRKMFKKTCHIIRRRQPSMAVAPSVYKRSAFAGYGVNLDLFGLKSFDDSVVELYETLKSFFTLVIMNLALCHRVLRDEKIAKADAAFCKDSYNESIRKSLSTAWVIKKSMEQVRMLPFSELAERKRNARSEDEFYKENYHQWNRGEFAMAKAVELLREAQNNGMTEEEMALWPKNSEKVMQVREAITLLDRMDDIEGNSGKWNSKIIVYLMKWSGVGEKNEKLFYEKYLCNEYKQKGGRLTPLHWGAIFAERKKLKNLMSDESLANKFAKLLEAVKQKPIEPKAEDELLFAANF